MMDDIIDHNTHAFTNQREACAHPLCVSKSWNNCAGITHHRRILHSIAGSLFFVILNQCTNNMVDIQLSGFVIVLNN